MSEQIQASNPFQTIKMIYLNTGTESILPESTKIFLEKEQKKYEENPTQGWIASLDRIWSLHQKMARFLKANPQDLFFRHNVTEALNSFLLGYHLPKGSTIAVTSLEYGAIVNICRLKAQREQLNLETIEIPLPLSPNEESILNWSTADYSQWILKKITPQTKLLVLSHVVTSNGMIFDVAFLAKELAKQGVLLVVDGAHSVGLIDVDFSKYSDVAFYGGNFHKWLMGPKGTGFGWTNPKYQSQVDPLWGSWTSFEITPPFDRFGAGTKNNYTLQQLMPGTRDFCNFYGLEDTLTFWEGAKADQIRGHIHRLRQFVFSEMEKTNPQFKRMSPKHCSVGLASFLLPEKLQSKGYGLTIELWEKHKVQLAFPRIGSKWGVRFSPHVWNSESDVVRACEALTKTAIS